MRRRRRRRWAHAPAIHGASHFDPDEKRVAWMSISMCACDFPVCIVMELLLTALRATGAPLKIDQLTPKHHGKSFYSFPWF